MFELSFLRIDINMINESCQIIINFISALKNISFFHNISFRHIGIFLPFALTKFILQKNQLKSSGAFNSTVFKVAKTAHWTFTTVEGECIISVISTILTATLESICQISFLKRVHLIIISESRLNRRLFSFFFREIMG